jgi:cytoskeletal protein CcmA (bactofilin family)
MQNNFARARENQRPGQVGADQTGEAKMDNADQRDKSDRAQMSVIGADITITGNIEASVDLHIEGRVQGDVRCATLILGESSSVNGSIFADRVRVSGVVDGAIETKDLAVEATARVTGDITYDRLRVANGGMLEGQMKRKAAEESPVDGKLKLVEPKVDPKPADPKPEVVVID